MDGLNRLNFPQYKDGVKKWINNPFSYHIWYAVEYYKQVVTGTVATTLKKQNKHIYRRKRY